MDTSTLYLYAKPTRFGTSQGLLLATQMIDAAPSGLPERAQASLLEVAKKRDALELIAEARVGLPNAAGQRALSTRLGNCWSAMRDAVVARARLEPADGSGEATAIARALFARGVSFVKAGHVDVWAFSTHVLNIIEKQQLAPRIDAIVGPMFLAAVREAHDAFAEVMTAPGAAEANLAEAIDDLSLALAEYGRHLLGWLDRDVPANLAAFARAVAPLDGYRRSLSANRRGAEEEPVAPADPITPAVAPVTPIS